MDKIGISQTLIKVFLNKEDGGFSLIEVVIALGVLSMMLLAVYEVSLFSMKRAEKTKQDLLALALAQSIMDEQLASGNWAIRDESGEAAGFVWYKKVTEYEDDKIKKTTGRSQLFTIRVSVNENIHLATLKNVEVAR